MSSKNIQFQIFSDIHIEYFPNNSFPMLIPYCDYLILAGDIGFIEDESYKDFFDYISCRWKKVYYVLGNHELYSNNICVYELENKYIDFFKQYDNVKLLHKTMDYIDIDGEKIYLIGAIGWSQACEESKKIVNCFNHLHYFDYKDECLKQVPIEIYNKWNKDNLFYIFAYLRNIVSNIQIKNINRKKNRNENNKHKQKVIIITHYPITQKNTFHPKYSHEPQYMRDIFANNINFLDYLSQEELELLDIVCISGHTHLSHNFRDNNFFHKINNDYIKNRENKRETSIQFISNQMGYKREFNKNESQFNNIGLYNLF